MRLNQILNFHKKKKTKKEDKEDASFANVGNFCWSTSNLYLMFLENTINKYTKTPVFGEDLKEPVEWLPS